MLWLILSVALAFTTKVATAHTPIQDVEFVRLASPSSTYANIACNVSGYYPLAGPDGWASEVNIQVSHSYLAYRPSKVSCEWKRQYWLSTNYSQLCNLPGTILVPPAGVSGGIGWVCNGVAAQNPTAPAPNCSWPDWGTAAATYQPVRAPHNGVAWATDAMNGLPVCGPANRPSYARQDTFLQSYVEFWPYCFGEQQNSYQTCSSAEFPANTAPIDDYIGSDTFQGIAAQWVVSDRAPYALRFSSSNPCYATPRWLVRDGELIDNSDVGYSAQVGQLVATSNGNSYGDQTPQLGLSSWKRTQVPTAAPARWSGDYGYPWGESSSFAGVGRTFSSPYCGSMAGNASYQWGPDDSNQIRLLHPESWASSSDPECICMLDGACVPKYSTKQRPASLGYLGPSLSFSVDYTTRPTTVDAPSTTAAATTTAFVATLPSTNTSTSTTTTRPSTTTTSTSTTTTTPSTTVTSTSTTTTRPSTTTTSTSSTTTKPSTTTTGTSTTTTRPSTTTTTTTTLAPTTTTAFVPTVCRATTIGVGSFQLCTTWTMPTANQLKCTLSRIFPSSQTCTGAVTSFAVADTGSPSSDNTINALCALMGYLTGVVAVGSYGTSAKAINPSFNLVSSNAFIGQLWCYK